MSIIVEGPNAEQIRYWNEISGPKWVALNEFLDAQIHPLGAHAIDRARLAPGETVLDVGCGCGATSLELARRVGAGGSVTGLDISAPMLQRARERAHEAGLAQVTFENADAQTHPFAPAFDLIFSRFGVMFFAQPAEAFANLRRALRPGGRLSFVCWQALPENPWMFVPFLAAAPHLSLPPPPAPDAPGPFAFADPERVRSILADAGFVSIALEDLHTTLTIGAGESLDRIVDAMLQLGPTGSALRQSAPEIWPRVQTAVREALQAHYTEEGLQMSAAAWVVTARGD